MTVAKRATNKSQNELSLGGGWKKTTVRLSAAKLTVFAGPGRIWVLVLREVRADARGRAAKATRRARQRRKGGRRAP
jgi:hypothetical protein